LNEGHEIIKNFTFKEFWNFVEEVEEMMKTNKTLTSQNLQEQIERQVHGEDERQAIRMQEMMQQMQREE